MKWVPANFLFSFTVLLNLGWSQAPPNSALRPTPLEAFSGEPNTRVSWSSEVGRIDSKEAHAVITVVIVEDTAQPPDRMRGIRVDLSKGDRRDVVYLGEETLPAYRDALDEISREAARQRSANNVRENLTPDGTAYVGACIFRYVDGSPPVHALSAAYYFAPDSFGMAVNSFRNVEFRFPNRDPSQLSVAISLAIDQLKNR
jgi:hypothetical protein